MKINKSERNILQQSNMDFVTMQKSKYAKKENNNQKSFQLDMSSYQSNLYTQNFAKKKNLPANKNLIYEPLITVKIQQHERQERSSQIKISIFDNQNSNSPHILFRLTEEKDLQFLKVLELTENEFYQLKAEQSLRVEFQQFASKFIELIELCEDQSSNEIMRFCCMLQLQKDGKCIFRIVEQNEFKQLDHLVLTFSQPSDEIVKTFLSDCLAQSQNREQQLNNEISDLYDQMESLKTQNEFQNQQIQEIQSSCKNQEEKQEIKVQNLLNELNQKYQKEIQELKDQKEKQKNLLQEQLQSQSKKQLAEIQKLIEKNQEKTLQLADSNFQIRDLRNRYDIVEQEYNKAMNLLKIQKEDCQKWQEKCIELEKIQRDNQIKLEFFQQQMESQNEFKSKLDENQKFFLESVQKQEIQIADLKKHNEKLENKLNQSAKEMDKANSILDRMENEIQKHKMKNKDLKKVIIKQEQKLQEQQHEFQQLQKQNNDLKKAYQTEQNNNEQNLLKISDLKEKLELSKQQLQENQTTISYLNDRLNDKSKNIFQTTTNNYSSEYVSSKFGQFSQTTQNLLKSQQEQFSQTFKDSSKNDQEKKFDFDFLNKNYDNPYFAQNKVTNESNFQDYDSQIKDNFKTVNKNNYENQIEEIQQLPKTIQPVQYKIPKYQIINTQISYKQFFLKSIRNNFNILLKLIRENHRHHIFLYVDSHLLLQHHPFDNHHTNRSLLLVLLLLQFSFFSFLFLFVLLISYL